MRLLNQDEIRVKKSEETRKTIDSGLALAKRVDELREKKNREEALYEKYREETGNILRDEIDALLARKESLEYEIGVLTHKSEDLKKPFDEEWELVKMKRISDLDDKLYDLEKRENILSKKELEMRSREADIHDSETRVSDEAKQSEQALGDAKLDREKAADMLDRAKLEYAQIEQAIENKVREFSRKEEEFVSKEKDLSMREEAFRRSVRELARRERFINDKYNTLLRTEKALSDKKKNQ